MYSIHRHFNFCFVPLRLQKKVKESQTENKDLRKEISSLKANNNQVNEKLSRTVEALRITGSRSASTKAENETLQARIHLLSNQLILIKTSVKETIENCNKVKLEHEEISKTARDLESRLLSADAELVRSQKDCKKLREGKEIVIKQHSLLQVQYNRVKDTLEETLQELIRSKKNAVAMDDVEMRRKLQTESIEKQLRQAQADLIRFSTTHSESETATSILKDAIQEISAENKKLHEKFAQLIESRDKEARKRDNNLLSAESESQRLKVQFETKVEEWKKLKLDKDETDKYVQQLKSQVAALKKQLVHENYQKTPNFKSERKQLPSTSFKISPSVPKLRSTDPFNNFSNMEKSFSDDKNESEFDNVFPLSSKSNFVSRFYTQKNDEKVDGGCAICGKKPSGLMKTCACGNPSCNFQVHAFCLSAKAKDLSTTVTEVSILCQNK